MESKKYIIFVKIKTKKAKKIFKTKIEIYLKRQIFHICKRKNKKGKINLFTKTEIYPYICKKKEKLIFLT